MEDPDPPSVCRKSLLHQYAQKSSLQLPMYQTINLGLPHVPQFKATVVVGGETFESSATFFHVKEAGARASLEGISHNLKTRGLPTSAAIHAILGSDTGTIMSQIINSKGRLYAALGVQDTKEMHSAATNDKLSSVAYEEHLCSGQPANTSSVISIPLGAKKPKEEVNEPSGLGGTGTSVSALQQIDPSTAANEFQGTASNSGQKRKNKKKKSVGDNALLSTDKHTQAQQAHQQGPAEAGRRTAADCKVG